MRKRPDPPQGLASLCDRLQWEEIEEKSVPLLLYVRRYRCDFSEFVPDFITAHRQRGPTGVRTGERRAGARRQGPARYPPSALKGAGENVITRVKTSLNVITSRADAHLNLIPCLSYMSGPRTRRMENTLELGHIRRRCSLVLNYHLQRNCQKPLVSTIIFRVRKCDDVMVSFCPTSNTKSFLRPRPDRIEVCAFAFCAWRQSPRLGPCRCCCASAARMSVGNLVSVQHPHAVPCRDTGVRVLYGYAGHLARKRFARAGACPTPH